mmetsp:Transcript_6071/g.22972  ORF Transcript_6071/g.22972 Transcript_6071/m.22972 type:complete len:453 (+) Transcript_6071:7545-8903(+)
MQEAKEAFNKEVAQTKSALNQRVGELEMSRIEYEELIRGKYEKLMAEMQAKLDAALDDRIRQEEVIRQQLQREKVDYELDVREKFNKLIEEKDAQLNELLKERESRLLEDDDKRSHQLMAQARDLEEQRIEHEQELRHRYERQFDDVRDAAKQQIIEAQKRMEEARMKQEEVEKQMARLEIQMRGMKHSMDLWKLDYHKTTTQKFQKMMAEVELRAKKEMEEFARAQLENEEKRLAEELKRREHTLRKVQASDEQDQDRAFQHQQDLILKDQEEKARKEGLQKLHAYKARVIELWQALETNPAERFQFMWNATNNTTTYDPKLLDEFQSEINRLSDQLPLMECVHRREFIKQRLSELDRRSSQMYGSDPSRSIRDEKQRKELEREIRRLTDELKQSVPKFEFKHGREFVYKGSSYLEVMNGENATAAGGRKASSRLGAAATSAGGLSSTTHW